MSTRAILLDMLLRLVLAAGKNAQDVAEEVTRRRSHGVPPSSPVPKAARRAATAGAFELDGCRVTTFAPRNRQPDHALIYFHGGGYVQPIARSQWSFPSDLAVRSGAQVYVPEYKRAPEGNARSAMELAQAVQDHVSRRFAPGTITLLGDSAGAGLALAHLIQTQRGNRPMARQALLLSPWVDVTMANPSLYAVAPFDVILNREELQAWGRVWADDLDVTDARVSPLYGIEPGLPPVHVFTGGRDLLMPDALLLHQRLKAAGNPGTITYFPDINHAGPLLGNAVPEARTLLRKIHAILALGAEPSE